MKSRPSEPSRPLGWTPPEGPAPPPEWTPPPTVKPRKLRRRPAKDIPETEPLYTTREVAKALRVSPDTVWRWHTMGRIKATRAPIGRGFGKGKAPELRFPLSEVRRLAGKRK